MQNKGIIVVGEDELAHNEEYVVTGADRKHTTVLVRVRNVVEVVK